MQQDNIAVSINNSNEPKKLEAVLPTNLQGNFNANFSNKFTVKDGKLKVSLEAHGSEVLL